jgi:regulator of protease activity HflC (stomatin/prohibitin superfamily)
MERTAERNAIVNLLLLLAAGAASLVVALYAGTLSGIVSVGFMGLGALICAVGWFQMRLLERERLEKLEFEELTRSAAATALFNARESEVFPAQRSREQFERFFVPGFAVLLFLLETGGGLYLLRLLQRAIPGTMQEPLMCLGLYGMLFLLLFLIGRYSTNLARMEKLPLLRPGATWVLFNAFLCLLVLAGVGVTWMGVPNVDINVARVEAGLLIFVGLETLINLILELYRPRVKGKAQRPIYESRVVSLLGQPEGLIRTAGQTLDYQFGFAVSETWVYRLFAAWLPWLIVAQLALLALSTSFVVIDPGEQAILERRGRFVEVWHPGAHFKFPWPIDRAFRYPAEKIQTIDVGFVPGAPDPSAHNTVLWTLPHAQETNFIVARRESGLIAPAPIQALTAQTTNADATATAPPVNLLTVGIPVQFQITNLEQWVYENNDPAQLLESIAYRDVIRYLVSADLDEIMSDGLGDAANTLRGNLQADADAHKLGVKIVFLGVEDIHPPVAVAKDYENVVSTIHTTNAMVLRARADAINTNALTDILVLKYVAEAESDRLRQETNAFAQAELFKYQLPAYLAAPSVYKKRLFLDTFAKAVAKTRTYLLLSTNVDPIAILDLEPKIRSDLDITLPPPTPGATR